MATLSLLFTAGGGPTWAQEPLVERTFLIAATAGRTQDAARLVEGSGGVVAARIDEIGYLRVTAATDLVDALQAFDSIDAIERVRDNPADACPRESEPRAAPEARTAFPNPLFEAGSPLAPLDDMGISGFQRLHPTFDGRGTTIAILEGCNNQVTDFLNPSLGQAMGLDGVLAPKIAGVIDRTATRPIDRTRPLPSHLIAPPEELSRDGDGRVSIDGDWAFVPSGEGWLGGTYRASNGLSYGVLWHRGGDRIWVDANANRDFRDDASLTDINVTFSAGRLAGPPGAAPLSFAASFHSAGRGVLIYEGSNVHQTMTAGAAAGHDLGGGSAAAAAPMARLLIVTPGSWSSVSLLEAYIAAAQDPRVDVISESWGLQRFSGVSGVIIDRLVALYGVVILHCAANSGPTMNTLEAADETAEDVLTVGGYQSAPTALAVFGVRWEKPATLWLGSSRGPTLGGRIKPDFVAPLTMITTAPCSSVYQGDEGGIAATHRLPACYMFGAGTSAATPYAAGAVAALISGLKQTAGSELDARRLNWALRTGASPLPGYGAYEQGYGRLDVPAAWALLQTAQPLSEFRVEAPLAHEDVRFHYDQPTGGGLFEREGWTTGQLQTRLLQIARLTGADDSVRYQLRWRGNRDQTFEVADTVELPLGETVEVPILIRPTSPGAHSALLELRDPASGLTVWAVGATIVAGHAFADGVLDLPTQVLWPDGASQFFNVPEGQAALEIRMTAGDHPVGVTFAAPGRWTNPAQASEVGASTPMLAAGEQRTIRIERPIPGTWEVRFALCATGLDHYRACGAGRPRATAVRIEAFLSPS